MALNCPRDRRDAAGVLPLSPSGGFTGEQQVGTDLVRIAPSNQRRRSLLIVADADNTGTVRILLAQDGGSARGFPLAAGAGVEVGNPGEVRAYASAADQTVHMLTEVD